MLPSRPATYRCDGHLSASYLVKMTASPFLERGNNLLADPHPRHQAELHNPSHGAKGKGSWAAKNQHGFLPFQVEGALLSDCMAQGGSVLVTISAELLRRSKLPG